MRTVCLAANSSETVADRSQDIFSPQYYGTTNDVYAVLLGNDTLKCYDCLDQQFYNRRPCSKKYIPHFARADT